MAPNPACSSTARPAPPASASANDCWHCPASNFAACPPSTARIPPRAATSWPKSIWSCCACRTRQRANRLRWPNASAMRAPKLLDASTAHRVHPDWAYGFPEMLPGQAERIAAARNVANPGCYPTGAIALIRPLVDAGLMPPDYPVTINAVSGYSGGGRSMIESHDRDWGRRSSCMRSGWSTSTSRRRNAIPGCRGGRSSCHPWGISARECWCRCRCTWTRCRANRLVPICGYAGEPLLPAAS